jgi:tetratricopeptide (TPR) repeat protein
VPPRAASDLGCEATQIVLELEPENAHAKCVQGMLYSAAGQLEEAASAFRAALTMDEELASALGLRGYNGIFFFFSGFAELMLGRTPEAVVLLQKSLERNPPYGSAHLFLTAALCLTGP